MRDVSRISGFRAANRYAVLSAISPRKAATFARLFEAYAREDEFDSYLDYIWGKADSAPAPAPAMGEGA